MDSQLIVHHVTRKSQCQSTKLQPLFGAVLERISQFQWFHLTHITRDWNQLADGICNYFIDAQFKLMSDPLDHLLTSFPWQTTVDRSHPCKNFSGLNNVHIMSIGPLIRPLGYFSRVDISLCGNLQNKFMALGHHQYSESQQARIHHTRRRTLIACDWNLTRVIKAWRAQTTTDPRLNKHLSMD